MKWPFQKRQHKAQARDKPQKVVRSRDLQMINRPRADATLTGNEAIYAAVSRISNTIASMPIHFYKGYEIQKDHPLERLVGLEPNPNFSAFTWKQTMEAMLNTEGTAYALKVLNAMGELIRLDILNPLKVTPKRDEAGNIWYGVRMDDGKEYVAPGFLFLVIKHMSANGIRGIRPIDVLRQSLDYDTQVKALSLDQLDGVNHGVALTIPSTGLGPAQKEDAIKQFLDAYEKSGRSVVILEGGMTATNFSSSPVDSQLLDVERITRNRVATVYNLPPHLLGDYTDTSFGTAEQQTLEYLQLTIGPKIQQWEDEMNRKLITPEQYAEGYHFGFDIGSLTRTDVKTTAERNQMAIRGGWRKPNEVRAELNLPPDKYGDQLMSSRDLIPLSIAVEHPELLLGGQTSGNDSEGKEENA